MNDSNSKFVIGENISFRHVIGNGEALGREIHTFHEIIYFMRGEAKFVSSNMHLTLKPNTVIVIPKDTKHQILITDSQSDYERCVFHFTDITELKELIHQSMSGVSLIDSNTKLHALFHQMIALSESSRSEPVNALIMQSVLSLILNEIGEWKCGVMDDPPLETISDKCVAYIKEHINHSVSLEDISEDLGLSVSHLAHTFKKEMGVPIHRYILRQKLIMAQHRILDGESATLVAIDCGFSSYSGFYKQFRKMFGRSPSDRGSNTVDLDLE